MITDMMTLYCFARYRSNGPLSGYSYAETTDAGTAASLRAWAQYEEIAVDWAVKIPRGSWPPLPREDAVTPTRLEHLDTDGETETWNATFERDAWVEFRTNPQRAWVLAFKAHSLDETHALFAWAHKQRYGQLVESK